MAKTPFREEKPYRKWHRIAFYVLMAGIAMIVISCVICFATQDANNLIANRLGYAAIICVVVFYAVNMVKWRCPNCHKPLPLVGPVLECRYCKRSFMDSKGNQVW